MDEAKWRLIWTLGCVGLLIASFIIFCNVWWNIAAMGRKLKVAHDTQAECGDAAYEGDTLRYRSLAIYDETHPSAASAWKGVWAMWILFGVLTLWVAIGMRKSTGSFAGAAAAMGPLASVTFGVLGILTLLARNFLKAVDACERATRAYKLRIESLVKRIESPAEVTDDEGKTVQKARSATPLQVRVAERMMREEAYAHLTCKKEALLALDAKDVWFTFERMQCSMGYNDMDLLLGPHLTSPEKAKTCPSSAVDSKSNEYWELQDLMWGAPTDTRALLSSLSWGCNAIFATLGYAAFHAAVVAGVASPLAVAGTTLGVVSVIAFVAPYTNAFSKG